MFDIPQDPQIRAFIFLIGTLFGIGCSCFTTCIIRWLQERKAFQKAKNAWKSQRLTNGLTHAQLRGYIQSKTLATSLIGKRIIDLCEWYEQGNRDEAPQLQDLHHKTLGAVESRPDAAILRTLTAVLLIVGICGTLWCVHACLESGRNSTIDLRLLGGALVPSKWAVTGTIALLILRGFYRLFYSRLLWQIDAYTMQHLLPDLQQMGDVAQEISRLAGSVRGMKKQLGNFSKSVQALQNTSAKLEAVINGIAQSDEKLENELSQARSSYESMESAYAVTRQTLDELVQTLNEATAREKATLEQATQQLNAQEDNRAAREKETAALQQLLQTAEQIRKDGERLAGRLLPLETMEQEIPALQAQFNTLRTSLVEESAETEQNLRSLQVGQAAFNTTATRLEGGIAELGSALNSVKQSAARVLQKEEEHAESLATYRTTIENYKENLKELESAARRYRPLTPRGPVSSPLQPLSGRSFPSPNTAIPSSAPQEEPKQSIPELSDEQTEAPELTPAPIETEQGYREEEPATFAETDEMELISSAPAEEEVSPQVEPEPIEEEAPSAMPPSDIIPEPGQETGTSGDAVRDEPLPTPEETESAPPFEQPENVAAVETIPPLTPPEPAQPTVSTPTPRIPWWKRPFVKK